MQIADTPTKVNFNSASRASRLLIVGPKPPPIGGSPLTVQAILKELEFYPDVQVTVINTSPTLDVRKKMTGFNLEKVKRSILILPQFLAKIGSADATLVFANDLFAITMAPILLFIARLFRKSYYIKPVGAGLDLFINSQNKPLREYLLFTLRSADGILTQTRLLKNSLEKLGCNNVQYFPGCRPQPKVPITLKKNTAELRLIFLGHITRLKGPLYLLDALKIVSEQSNEIVTCDFYGPIHNEIRDEFLNSAKSIPGVRYCGMAEPGTGSQLIAQYDALVLPTYYDTEGHPGVLIEAMHVGIPVISTLIRTLPELITNGENGFLVPTQNSSKLAEAILTLAKDPVLRKKMGEANYLRGEEFRTENVVAKLLQIVFPGLLFVKEERQCES